MDNKGEIVIYQTQDGTTQLDVRHDGETVWITQDQMAQLFQRDRTAIGRHISNIFSEGELDKNVVCANFAHTTLHGAIEGKTQTRELTYYNLDVIISVGYRVHSHQGTQFRIWATQRLRGDGAVDERVKMVVRVIGKAVLPRRQLVADLQLRQKSRRTFIDHYLKPACGMGLIAFAYPNLPTKPEQAYKLTAKGLELEAEVKKGE